MLDPLRRPAVTPLQKRKNVAPSIETGPRCRIALTNYDKSS